MSRFFAGHFQKPQLSQAEDIGFHAVFFQLFFQRGNDLFPIFFLFHIDKVDDDNAADIAQPHLTDDFFHRFDIGVNDGIFQVRRAHVFAGIHIDGRQRFGIVDHDVAAVFQPRFPFPGLFDFFKKVVFFKDRHHVGDGHTIFIIAVKELQPFDDRVVGFLTVDDDPRHIFGDLISEDAGEQIQIFIDQAAAFGVSALVDDLAPDTAQPFQIGQQFFFAGALSHGAHNNAHAFGADLFRHFRKTLAFFFIFDPTGNADIRYGGHQHKVTPGQRQMGRHPSAFGRGRFLHDLNQNFLSFFQQIVDTHIIDGLIFRRNFGQYFADIEKAVFVQPDIHKGRLHSGENIFHDPLIDIAGEPFFIGAVNIEFYQAAVFHHGDHGFIAFRPDNNFFFHSTLRSGSKSLCSLCHKKPHSLYFNILYYIPISKHCQKLSYTQ